jgi:hypothetical protein
MCLAETLEAAHHQAAAGPPAPVPRRGMVSRRGLLTGAGASAGALAMATPAPPRWTAGGQRAQTPTGRYCRGTSIRIMSVSSAAWRRTRSGP